MLEAAKSCCSEPASQENQLSLQLQIMEASALSNESANQEEKVDSPYQKVRTLVDFSLTPTSIFSRTFLTMRFAQEIDPKLNWNELRRLCQILESVLPCGKSPSSLFRLEIFDADDVDFLTEVGLSYAPIEIYFEDLIEEVATAVNRSGWLLSVREQHMTHEMIQLKATAVDSPTDSAGWLCCGIARWATLCTPVFELVEKPSFSDHVIEHCICALLKTALLRCGLVLCLRNRADASHPDTDATTDIEGIEFPDFGRGWADAYVRGKTSPRVSIFFLKSSVSLGSNVTLRQSDRVKVVRMAACCAWEAMQRVPPHKRDLGLGCIAAHLYEEDSKGDFLMDVYYVC
jgi:hypothetical protein